MPVPEDTTEYLTATQAADLLQLDRRTILRYVNKGELRAHRLGAAIRIKRSDLGEFLAERTTDAIR